MENSRRIFGIGETVLDIVLKDGQPLAAVPGGSTFNALVSLGRTLGRDIPVLMVSQTGDDKVGGIIREFMGRNSLREDLMREVHGQTPVSIAILDGKNNASYQFLRDAGFPVFKAPEVDFHPGDVVIFGSYYAVSDATFSEVKSLVTKARESGAVIYYDINFRKNHHSELDKLLPRIKAAIALSDIVRGSSEDIEAVYGSSDPVKVYNEYISKACPNFICTRGGDPATLLSPGTCCSIPVPKSGKIVSTIGAGDNFNAGTLYSIIRNGFTREKLRGSSQDGKSLTAEDWKVLTYYAFRFSGEVCESIFNYVPEGFEP